MAGSKSHEHLILFAGKLGQFCFRKRAQSFSHQATCTTRKSTPATDKYIYLKFWMTETMSDLMAVCGKSQTVAQWGKQMFTFSFCFQFLIPRTKYFHIADRFFNMVLRHVM